MKLFQRLLVAPAALGLMAPVAANADTAFSPTTTLNGGAFFTTGSVAAGTGDDNEELYMQYAYSLELNSSFTGDDNLYAEIEAGNASGPLADLDSAVEDGDALTVSSLFYSFPIGDLSLTGGPLVDQDDVLAATTSAYSGTFRLGAMPYSEAGDETGPGLAVSYATDNGLVASVSLISADGADSALGINSDDGNDVTTFSLGYDSEGFGGGIVFASNDGDTGNTTGYDTFGGGLYYSPESVPATFSIAYDTTDNWINPATSVGTDDDATDFFIGIDWEVGPGSLAVAYNSTDVDDNTDDTDSTGYEVSYSYPVNDNVTVTPGIFTVEETDGTNDDSGFVVETAFSF